MSVQTTSAMSAQESTQARHTRSRNRLWWTISGAIIIAAGVLIYAVQASLAAVEVGRLDPNSHGPGGFRAVAEVLRQQGIDVQVTGSRADAAASADRGGVLVMVDAPALSDAAVADLLSHAETVILLEPTSRLLDLAFDDASTQGVAGEEVTPRCDIPLAEGTGAVFIRTVLRGGDDGCYPVGDGAGLIVAERNGTTTYAIDGTIFTNEAITTAGNAALALGLLGQQDRLTWYVPSLLDSDLLETDAPQIGDLVPGWVTPTIVLFAIAGVTAAIWRGRRFGPLVAERLPVTVRASETMEGRARMYAKGRDSAHAAAVLRRDTARRIGRMLGMGAAATPVGITEAAAAAIGAPIDVVRSVLIGAAPASDAALVDLSDRLKQLEAAVRSAVGSERKPS